MRTRDDNSYDGSAGEILSALRACLARPHERAWSMPAGFYTSPEFLAVETGELFHREWVCIGRAEEAASPGDYWTTDLLGEPLLVVRAGDGRLRVFSNVCRHRGMPVANGRGNAQHLQCPYHAWTYDLRGRLLRAPLIEGRDDFDQASCGLPEVATEVWQGFLFVNLDGQASPLAPRLEGLVPLVRNYHMEDMVLGHCETESWDTNWKCLTENFMEGYHLSHVHYETLHPVTPTRLCEHFPAGEGYLGYYSGFPADLPQRGRYHPDLTDAERGYCVMFAIMPGLVAGVAGHMATFICLQPESVDRVRGKRGIVFGDPDIEEDDRLAVVDLFERTMAEDKVQLSNLGRGLRSRSYRPGPLGPPDVEGTVWDFYRYMARRLG